MHCVDLGESFPTSIYLQNLASIQPRTSLVKFARSPRTDPPGVVRGVAGGKKRIATKGLRLPQMRSVRGASPFFEVFSPSNARALPSPPLLLPSSESATDYRSR